MADESDGGGVPEWVVTFGDMMSLLLTFFIMLFSMSEIRQEERFQAMLESMRRTFGYTRSEASLAPGEQPPARTKLSKLASLGRSKRQNTLRGGARKQSSPGTEQRVTSTHPSGRFSLGGVVQFDEASDHLDQEAKKVLQLIARDIRGKPQMIELAGHSTGRPLPRNGAFSTHYDLAYRRCVGVMNYMVDELGINPDRFSIRVVAANEPLPAPPLETGRDPQSRVEVRLLDQIAPSVSRGVE